MYFIWFFSLIIQDMYYKSEIIEKAKHSVIFVVYLEIHC